jgi:hypothetical protein
MTFIILLLIASLIIGVAYWLRKFLWYITWFLFGLAMLGLPVMFIDLEIGLSMLVYGLCIFLGTWLVIYASAAIVAFVAVPLAILVAFFKSVFRIR